MIRSFPNSRLLALRRACRSLIDDIRGVAAVEFGIIAPVLLVMLVGVIEVTRAVSIDRRFGQVTSMVADLVAREENISAEDLDGVSNGKRTGVYAIVEHVMGVWGTDTLKLQIIPVQSDPVDASIRKIYAGVANRPSFGAGAAVRPACEDYTDLSADLLGPNSSVIVVESEFGYTPLFADGMIPPKVWKDKAIMAPRNQCVDFDDNNCVSNCF